ncbi:MAG: hypothetical protein VCD00_08615, partial [Candidatus Hydrogenedentota bacterium]
IDARTVSRARKRNYQYLLERLRNLAFWADWEGDWVPLGFPILTEAADHLWEHLSSRDIFAPRHWRDLPSPKSAFSEAHDLSNRIMTLPCDQRYTTKDMERVVQCVLEVCP